MFQFLSFVLLIFCLSFQGGAKQQQQPQQQQQQPVASDNPFDLFGFNDNNANQNQQQNNNNYNNNQKNMVGVIQKKPGISVNVNNPNQQQNNGYKVAVTPVYVLMNKTNK